MCLSCSGDGINGINASAAIQLLKKPEKNQAMSGIRTHDLCVTLCNALPLSYQSHMGAVVYGLAQVFSVAEWPHSHLFHLKSTLTLHLMTSLDADII